MLCNGEKVSVLCDTGACKTVMTRAPPGMSQTIKVQCANGEISHHRVTQSITFKDPETDRVCHLPVIVDPQCPVPLLGRDAMLALKIFVTAVRGGGDSKAIIRWRRGGRLQPHRGVRDMFWIPSPTNNRDMGSRWNPTQTQPVRTVGRKQSMTSVNGRTGNFTPLPPKHAPRSLDNRSYRCRVNHYRYPCRVNTQKWFSPQSKTIPTKTRSTRRHQTSYKGPPESRSPPRVSRLTL